MRPLEPRGRGGAVWADVDGATQAFGSRRLRDCVDDRVAASPWRGYGWLGRLHGLAADNVESFEVVTADGRVLTAHAGEYHYLFWGLRGGGGNFGVVTAFDFRLHRVGPDVLFGPTLYRLEDAPAVLRHYRDFANDAPRECTVYVDFFTAPPLPFLPRDLHGRKLVALVQCFVGDLAIGEQTPGAASQLRPSRGRSRRRSPIHGGPELFRRHLREGLAQLLNAHNLATLDAAAIETLIGLAATLPTPQSDIILFQLGGAIADVAEDATAYPHRSARFVVSPGARWSHPLHDEACLGWVRRCHAALADHATGGAYVNFIAEPYGRARDAFGANYARLAELKHRYDPDNIFRLHAQRPTDRVIADLTRATRDRDRRRASPAGTE